MYSQQQRRYLSEAVETAGPATRLVMLYDRLLLDLTRAEKACHDGNVPDAHQALVHAQQIVGVLSDTLDLSAWDGAQGLHDLYEYLYQELIGANLEKSAVRVVNCFAVVRPLAAAWHEAAAVLAAEAMAEQTSHGGHVSRLGQQGIAAQRGFAGQDQFTGQHSLTGQHSGVA